MSKPIEEGAKCVVIGGRKPNNGTVVTVVKFVGKVDWFGDNDMWEVDKPMETIWSTCVYFISEKRLRRIDGKQELSSWEVVAKDCKWNPNEVTA